MSFTVIIPARFASSRLPGKPLLDIAGKPMIQHVWERACQSAARRVVIATDHEGVLDACRGFGAEVCMTSDRHESGTDRLQEVVSQLALADDEIVVNVQGDEPLIPAELIDQVAGNLAAHPTAGIATLAESIDEAQTLFNPNAVKVVCDASGYALYFSRAPLPWCRDEWAGDARTRVAGAPFFRHIGIYAYRVGFLHRFVQWPMGQLESLEKLEQLRAMENGVRIHVAAAAAAMPGGVDTEADLQRVRQRLGGAMSTRVLFVCLGNICRSPTAHGVFQHLVDEAGLGARISVDSAGTGDWHIGHPPDRRMLGAARARGYDLSSLQARQVTTEDFYRFDYILAMDRANLADLQALRPPDGGAHLALLLDFASASAVAEVPDPYYGGDEGFETVLDLVEDAAAGLLRAIAKDTTAS